MPPNPIGKDERFRALPPRDLNPAFPRWAFARRPVLYMLYVSRNVENPGPIQTDPCVRLLGQLLPVLNKTLGED